MNDYPDHFKTSLGAKEYFVAYSHLAVLNIEGIAKVEKNQIPLEYCI